MPKIKTHKGTAKRVRKSGSGKLLRGHPFSNHFLSKKSAARKRAYSGVYEVKGKAVRTLEKKLGKK